MKLYRNVLKLIEYLGECPRPMTVALIARAGVLSSRDASDALQYGIRLGVIERIDGQELPLKRRFLYRLTGQPLPPVSGGVIGPSFDALLAAWGIARVPPRLPCYTSLRRVYSD